MKTIHHHPEDASLTAYAAGSLPASLALVISCHLEYCPACRGKVAKAEALGGALMEDAALQPLRTDTRAAMLARLDEEPATPPPASNPAPIPTADSKLPQKLQRLLGNADLGNRDWRSAGPGVRILRLDCDEGKSILLDIAPGHSVPVHSHRGNELTLILDGEYDDELGHFASGDVADLDGDVQHQPKAGLSGCLCLAGLDAPLQYQGLIPRLLQPFFPL